MTIEDFMRLVADPESVQDAHAADLKELVERYPYFCQARLLYLKFLQQSGSIHFDPQVGLTVLYASDRNWLYLYLHPDARLSEVSSRYQRDVRFSGGYFDLLRVAESGKEDVRISLKKIAENLKASRSLLQAEKPSSVPETVTSDVVSCEKNLLPAIDHFEIKKGQIKDMSLEEKSRLYIRQKKYEEAIEILKQLNLINPKKSVYFADQIRFLEKIIVNSK